MLAVYGFYNLDSFTQKSSVLLYNSMRGGLTLPWKITDWKNLWLVGNPILRENKSVWNGMFALVLVGEGEEGSQFQRQEDHFSWSAEHLLKDSRSFNCVPLYICFESGTILMQIFKMQTCHSVSLSTVVLSGYRISQDSFCCYSKGSLSNKHRWTCTLLSSFVCCFQEEID